MNLDRIRERLSNGFKPFVLESRAASASRSHIRISSPLEEALSRWSERTIR